jgi:16S rRNA (cytosine967-C5)-methyltransferase
MHLGLVQIFFLDRVPPHAAVSETVGCVRETIGSTKVKAANAILRAALRARQEGHCGDPRRDVVGRPWHLADPVFRDPEQHPLLWIEDALSMPAPIAKRWTARYGEETTLGLAHQALAEPPVSVRVAAGTREELERELTEAGLHPRPGRHERILLLPPDETEDLVSSAPFRAGRATVQGETALRAAEAVQAGPAETVLDLCAAPGGKTAVLAGAGALVTACDVSAVRLERLQSTLARLDLAGSVRCLPSDDPSLGDERFDAVLVDAPCTNSAVLAQRPEARWRIGPASKRSLVELQGQLMRQGAERVRPGGRLVWSTCALDPDENRRAVDHLLAERPDYSLEEDAEALPDLTTVADDGPGPIDGGYFARLRRSR